MSRAARNTRPKKLAPRQNIQIVREDQVDSLVDFDNTRGPIETGVEKAEESEYHLQQAIKASQTQKQDAAIKDGYIPTPPTIASDVQYDVLYPKGFQQPATYIRSSATVEDCAGVPYCMDEDDEVALKQINVKLPNGQPPISEDQFEEVMNFFEEIAQHTQPYAAVDSPPVLTLEELQIGFDSTHPEHVKSLSIFVYTHWSTRREASGNRGLSPHLKFETHQETDDSDPYVCFRRRELRQIRKTRNRDAQSAEKLRKLRMELESARNVLLMVKRREQMRRDVLELDRQVFEQRLSFRDTKRKLGIKGDEELLVNQKKAKVPVGMSPRDAALAQGLRMPHGAGIPGMELRALEDVQANQARAIANEIQNNIDKHIRWNEGWKDMTRFPLTPESDDGFHDPSAHFREALPATLSYYPTPPASHSDDEIQHDQAVDTEIKEISRASTPFGYLSPTEDEPSMRQRMPSFRRRPGRGGRMHIDRRFPMTRRDRDPQDDAYKYDTDHEDVEDTEDVDDDRVFEHISLRAHLFNAGRPQQDPAAAQKRLQLEAGQSSSHPSQSPANAQPAIAS